MPPPNGQPPSSNGSPNANGNGNGAILDGLMPVNHDDLKEYEDAMVNEVIPEIIKTMKIRARLAEEARHRIL